MLRWMYDKIVPHGPVAPEPSTPGTQSQASQAVRESSQNLRRAHANGPRVATLAGDLRDQRTRNHFAEMLQETMRRA